MLRPASACAVFSLETPAAGAAPASTPGPVKIGATFCARSSRRGEALALGFRMTFFLAAFVLTAALGLRLTIRFGFFGGLPLLPFALAGLGLRRRVLGLPRGTRRTGRAAGFTAFPERGFFVLIPCCDPFGRRRILSDAPHSTVAAGMTQRESALARGCVRHRSSLIPAGKQKRRCVAVGELGWLTFCRGLALRSGRLHGAVEPLGPKGAVGVVDLQQPVGEQGETRQHGPVGESEGGIGRGVNRDV